MVARSEAAARARALRMLRSRLQSLPLQSHAELAQVVIHVEVAPAQPVLSAHSSEDRMSLSLEIALLPSETLDKVFQLFEVRLELGRLSPANLLIYFRHGFHAWRPT